MPQGSLESGRSPSLKIHSGDSFDGGRVIVVGHFFNLGESGSGLLCLVYKKVLYFVVVCLVWLC